MPILRSYAALASATLLAASCGQEQVAPSEVNFASAHSVAVDARIDNGVIYTDYMERETAVRIITDQIMFAIGQLNGQGGGLDMKRTRVRAKPPVWVEGRGYRHEYKAKLSVSWDRRQPIPEEYSFILPTRPDFDGIYDFTDKYGKGELGEKCLDSSASGVNSQNHWYYYRPLNFECPMSEEAFLKDNKDLQVVQATFKRSKENTKGKMPEYDKAWEDGKLDATIIIGKYESGATSNFDGGIQAYRSTYRGILNQFGLPIASNLPRGVLPSSDTPEIHLSYASRRGRVEIHLYLIDGIRGASPEFVAEYDKRTQESDVIAYNGHSGYGANIRALARMGTFTPGQWQLFFVNGCDSYAYVDSALQDAHQAVNPGFGPDKHIDLITNAMPAYFHSMDRANIAILAAMVEGRKSYEQILASFDSYQKAAVTGEQDNGEF